jgi:hypothetical protein
MREQYQLESDADFLNEALFFAQLVEGEVPLRTPEARELSSLDSTAIRFRRMMRRYRVEPWDVLSGPLEVCFPDRYRSKQAFIIQEFREE